MRKRILAAIVFLIVLISSFMPVYAAPREGPPDEKVITQNGSWDVDSYISMDGQRKFYSMYTGDKKQAENAVPKPFRFAVNNPVRLSRIHIEHNYSGAKDISTSQMMQGREIQQNELTDGEMIREASKETDVVSDGGIMISVDEGISTPANAIDRLSDVKFSVVGSDGKRYGPWQAIIEGGAMIEGQESPQTISATVLVQDGTVLKKGKYTLEVSGPEATIFNKETKYAPAALIIGVDNGSWKSYEESRNGESVKEMGGDQGDGGRKGTEQKDTDEKKGDTRNLKEFGQIMISTNWQESDYKPLDGPEDKDNVKAAVYKNAVITLDKEYYIDEIQTDHYNDGNGAAPGTILLSGESGGVKKNYGPWQAEGYELDGASNGVWCVSPDVVVPAGTYTIVDSGTDTLSYDIGTLEPMFYVRVTDPPVYDFTGTYFINVKTACTSSMNPSKIGKPTSFDRDGFEIALIDRGETMELTGRYTQEKKKDPYFGNNSTEYDFKDVPFSQLCPVVKRDGNKATISFKFDVDLTGLPYKARVGTNVLIDLDATASSPMLKATGTAYYSRAYKEGYGGDNNRYSVSVNGQRNNVTLPGYVQEQMAKVGRAGNVPGPETAEQAAAGLLFPPLTALILQIALTMKKPKYIPPSPDEGGGGFGSGVGGSGDGGSGSDGSDGSYDGDESSSDGSGDSGDYGGGDSGESSVDGTGSYGDGSNGDSSGSSDADYGSGDGNYGSSDKGSGSGDDSYDYGTDSGGSGNAAGGSGGSGGGGDDGGGGPFTGSASGDQDGKGLPDPSGGNNGQGDGGDSDAGQEPVPQDGDTMTLKTKPDGFGRTNEYNVRYDGATGNWIDTESGNIISVSQFDEFNRNVDANNRFNQEQVEKLKNRDTDFDRSMDELVRQEKERSTLINVLTQMQKDSYGIGTENDPNKVSTKISDLINDLIDRDRSMADIRKDASKTAKVVGDFRTGAAISEADAANIHAQDTFTNAVLGTASEGMQDIIQGRTWAGMAGRMVIGVATGGVSEIPMSVAEGMMNIKDNIDKGDDGLTATIKAMGSYVVGEIAGEGASKVIGKVLQRPAKYITENYGGAIKRASEYLNKPVSEIVENSSIGKGVTQVLETIGIRSAKEGEKSFNRGMVDALKQQEWVKYKNAAENKVANFVKKVESGDKISLEDVKSILKDTRTKRQMNKTGQSAIPDYNKALNETLYDPTKADTIRQLENYKGKKVEMHEIRTPGKDPLASANADLDTYATEKVVNAQGQTITKEIDKNIAGGLRQENFAKHAGMINPDGSFNVTKARQEFPGVDWDKLNRTEQLKQYSKRFEQETLDVFDPEASIDFSSNSSSIRRWDLDQFPEGRNNIQNIIEGKGKLLDAEQLGKMDVFKVDKYLKNAGSMADQCEGFEQLGKMGNMADKLTTAYQNNGMSVNSLTDDMKKAIAVASDWNLSPAQKTIRIQELGFKGPMDLADKLSGRIEGLKMAQQMNPDGVKKGLSDAVSRILINRLNEKE